MYCQECRTPLKLDGSLNELNPAAFKLLAESASGAHSQDKHTSRHGRQAVSALRRDEYDRVSNVAKDPTYKRSVGTSRTATQAKPPSRDGPDMSFIMLTDSHILPTTETAAPAKSISSRRRSMHQPPGHHVEDDSLSNRMETVTRLFEILSAQSDIDHPICVECTERLVNELQKRLGNASRERDAYVEFLRQANADVPTDEELAHAKKELQHIQAQERAAFAELEQLEAEKAAMEAEIIDLESQSRELDIEEEKFWADRNAFSQKLSALQNERDGLHTRYEHDAKQLERLRRANVYNDTFPIGHDGYFGTINGLRLGRLPEKQVDWAEINAAWGHTCLLLATVAQKLNYTFKGYDLIPMGSTSRIRQYKPTPTSISGSAAHQAKSKPRYETLKLHTHGEALSTLGGLRQSEFESAMIAFLECLRQLIEHAHRTPVQGVKCPRIAYKIEKDRIGDHSIRLSGGLGSQEAEWTKACKITLICCKYLLAHASNVK